MIDYETKKNWKPVCDWVEAKSHNFDGTVYAKDGERLDWGQALCREIYGKNWNTDPQFKIDGDSVIVAPIITETVNKWTDDYWPDWVDKERMGIAGEGK